MSLFGQVWLWSAAAFLIGVLLTWLLLVRPVQARNRVLERRLRAALATPQEAAPRSAPVRPVAPPTRAFEPELDRYPSVPEPEYFGGEPDPEPLERLRAVEPEPPEPFRPVPEPEPEEPEHAWFEKDYKDYDDAVDEERIEPVEPPAQEYAGLSSVLEPDRALDPATTSVFQPTDLEPIEGKGSEHGTLFDPDEPVPAGFPETEPPAYAFSDGDAPGADEAATETTHVLPRRQRRQPTRDGSAQPLPPMMRPIERRDPVLSDEGGRSGSLFEPAVRRSGTATDSAPTPPPARTEAVESSVPPGPFGPGSAMPRPGGGRPAEDFTVKASVTALRYCTEESPHYARMIAEVWFRTVADAERVGFRALS